ncbi:hypothetical protein QJQ45_017152, partial [Haematococcus lacustris]
TLSWEKCLPLCRPVNAMVNKKRGVMARCASAQKAREVMAQRRAAEAEAKAQAGAAEAKAEAQADAGAYEAQLHQLQPDLQQREQQAADTQRLQHLQQQMQDLQQDELQRKEQQVPEQQQQLQQQQADMHMREQQLAEQQHQLQQQKADMQQREQQVAQQQQQLQQQQADLQQREQQVAQPHHQVQQRQADLQQREQQVAQQHHQMRVQGQQSDLTWLEGGRGTGHGAITAAAVSQQQPGSSIQAASVSQSAAAASGRQQQQAGSGSQTAEYAGHCLALCLGCRYAYVTGPLLNSLLLHQMSESVKAGIHVSQESPQSSKQQSASALLGPPVVAKAGPQPVTQWPFEDDAFHTIMQWLYSRIPHTRSKLDSQQLVQELVPRLSNQELESIGIQPQVVRSALLQAFADGGPGKSLLLVDSEGTEKELGFYDKQDFERWVQANILMKLLPDGKKQVVAASEYLEDGGSYFTNKTLDKRVSGRPAGRQRCRVTRSTWCGQYHKQPPLAWAPAPRGSKLCPNNCSFTGNCNHDTGQCDCPAGWEGLDCSTRRSRPCTNRFRSAGDEPAGHIDVNGRDLDWTVPGWKASRCPGICDDTYAACYCDGKYGFIPPPPPSAQHPYGSPPVKYGRMLGDHCFPSTTYDGRRVSWGQTSYEKVYGASGWCNATNAPEASCGCYQDGYYGNECEKRYEQTCMNQCSGHGECVVGFCKCHDGWWVTPADTSADASTDGLFAESNEAARAKAGLMLVLSAAMYGTDCARKIAGAPMEPSLLESRPWLRQHVGLPLEAQPQLPSTPRKRPLIYIYDLPPAYNARMLQYRVHGPSCVWRKYGTDNHTITQDNNVYGVEPYFWEALSQSQYRTFDPEQADFFYVPLFISCWLLPVWSTADYPWWHGPSSIRVHQASNLMLEVQQWLQKTHPWWDRRGGRDHVWLTPHDEGACWAPRVITDNSIILTHWGRMDANHTSNTAYGGLWLGSCSGVGAGIGVGGWVGEGYCLQAEGYSLGTAVLSDPGAPPLHRCQHHAASPSWLPLFTQDLVIPSWKPPHHFKASPLMGALPLERDVLFYFKGDVGKSRLKWYSRHIRQTLYTLSIKEQWREKYTIMIGDRNDLPPGYSEWLARSKYCLVAPGDGWSGRMEDAILHGCVPVIIMDRVHAVFETILNVDQFAVHITEAQMAQLPTILLSIPDDKWQRMQRRITRIWHRYAYATGPLQGSGIVKVWKQGSQAARENHLASVDEWQLKDRPAFTPPTLAKAGPRPMTQWPFEDDAFHTIMQWLYSRIPHTRSKPDSQQTG